MTFISPDVQAACQPYDVYVAPNVSAGIFEQRLIGMESPSRISAGSYDVDLIGAYSYVGGGETWLRHVGLIGRFCSIAPDVRSGDFEHPTGFVSTHPLFQNGHGWQITAADFIARNQATIAKSQSLANELHEDRFGKIQIGNDVWIGQGAFIRRGVEIGDGAIVGARSVVTRDVPPYAVVAGTPARILRYRFDPDVIAELLNLQWWGYGLTALEGVDFTDIDAALHGIRANIESGRASPYQAPVLQIGQQSLDILHYEPEAGAFLL